MIWPGWEYRRERERERESNWYSRNRSGHYTERIDTIKLNWTAQRDSSTINSIPISIIITIIAIINWARSTIQRKTKCPPDTLLLPVSRSFASCSVRLRHIALLQGVSFFHCAVAIGWFWLINWGMLFFCSYANMIVLPDRQFLKRAYPTMKKNNPYVPVLMREAFDTQPRVFARYGGWTSICDWMKV